MNKKENISDISKLNNLNKKELLSYSLFQTRRIGYDDSVLYMSKQIGVEKIFKLYKSSIKKYSKQELVYLYEELYDIEHP